MGIEFLTDFIIKRADANIADIIRFHLAGDTGCFDSGARNRHLNLGDDIVTGLVRDIFS